MTMSRQELIGGGVILAGIIVVLTALWLWSPSLSLFIGGVLTVGAGGLVAVDGWRKRQERQEEEVRKQMAGVRVARDEGGRESIP